MREQHPEVLLVDVVVALSDAALGAAAGAARRAGAVLAPVGGAVLRPRWLPPRLQPARRLADVARRGERRRLAAAGELSRRLDELVPVLLDELLRRVDLTEVVLRDVDLDRVVAAVDLDAAAARLDVAAVVERVDVDPVVARVDLDGAARRLDLDAVAARLDLDAVLARLDLTAIVLERVDLDAVLRAVLDRLDLVGLAAEVIDGVDLPEIIRESTGSMASDTVQGVRMQAIGADEAVGRAVDRFLLRRTARSTRAPALPTPRDRRD